MQSKCAMLSVLKKESPPSPPHVSGTLPRLLFWMDAEEREEFVRKTRGKRREARQAVALAWQKGQPFGELPPSRRCPSCILQTTSQDCGV